MRAETVEQIGESRVAIGLSLPLLAVVAYAVWRFVPNEHATEAFFRLGMLVGAAGVAIDYGRRLVRPALRASANGFRGNPIWSNKRGVERGEIARYELRREVGLTTLRVFGPSDEVLYRIWLQPDPSNVRSAVRFLRDDVD